MKRYFLWTLIIIGLIYFNFVHLASSTAQEDLLKQGLDLLKYRKDRDALVVFEEILAMQPDNLDALWGKAEVLRRSYKHQEAEAILNRVLSKEKNHPGCLISLSYIRYKQGQFKKALRFLRKVLAQPNLDVENKALVYMLMGSINATLAKKSNLLFKVGYGTHIRGYFQKANQLAPDLAEVHLGMGTFYLLAPKIIGGDLNKAQEELECAVKLTPEFATANVRLAQLHKKKGDLEKYAFYLSRAQELDPENEALKEIQENK